MPETLLFDPEQKFACRDCAARCCRMPMRVVISESELQRLHALPWVGERLRGLGVDFQRHAGFITVPTVEHQRYLQCAFLDEDERCSIHKHEGVAATPLTCQTFPFGFVQEPDGLRAYLSHLCPSIRDNYGDLLAPTLPQKRAQFSDYAPKKIVPFMTLATARVETRDYLAWADIAARALEQSTDPATTLGQLAHWTSSLAAEVSPTGELPANWLALALPAPEPVPTAPPRSWPLSTRLLLGLCLLPAGYPMRVEPLRRGFAKPGLYFAAFAFMRRITRFRGIVDLLLTPAPVEAGDAAALAAPGKDPANARRLGAYAGGLLRRRNFFLREQSLHEVVFHLTLACAISALHARFRAAARGADRVTLEDLREGESIEELVHTYHGNLLHANASIRALMNFQAVYPPALQHLRATL
jgi:lysine-N-methylase